MMQKNEISIFISFASEDVRLVRRLEGDLSDRGFRVIREETHPEVREFIQSEHEEALKSVDCVLILLTNNSASSKIVLQDANFALGYISAGRKWQLLLPIVYGVVDVPPFLKGQKVILWRGNYNEMIDTVVRQITDFKQSIPTSTQQRRKTSEEKTVSKSRTEKPPTQSKRKSNEPPREESEEAVTGEEKDEVQGKEMRQEKGDWRAPVSPAQRNYWLLKMNPQTWLPDHLTEGKSTFFSTYYFGEKRPEYSLFEKIRGGDVVLGFLAGNSKSIVCEMEVTQPVHQERPQGEVFSMTVTRSFARQIPLSKFAGVIPDIAPRLLHDSKPPELFFEIFDSLYNNILAVGASNVQEFEHNFLPFLMSEGNHAATRDQLDFENDYNSFATVIALKSVNPPLAIGLFGNWGSGKSFFMEKLSQRIDELALLKDDQFVERVVQVKFNSWHYSDTNLWASLTTQIFESLNDYAQNKQVGPKAIEAMYKDVHMIGAQLEETKRKLEENKVQAEELKKKKESKEEIIRQKKETLKLWNARDFVKIVFSDSFIQNDFNDIKVKFQADKLIDNINEIDGKFAEVDTTLDRARKSYELLKQNKKGNWLWVWGLAMFFIAVYWLATGPFKEHVEHIVSGATLITGSIAAWLTTQFARLKPFFEKVNMFYKRLKSLKETVEREKAKVHLKEHDVVASLQTEIDNLTNECAEIKLEQQQIEEKKTKLENEIKDIGSGRVLAKFLAGKSADDAYLKQLGIISWIRKDFSTLNTMFQNQKDVQKRNKDIPLEAQIDRIVLYIDDLDRCNEDVVVKVLEAIHLLLAFPLFVVVVGVDPRWLNNALSEKYKNLFGYRRQVNDTEQNAPDVPNDPHNPILKAATSYDYLEKIFQIPFALKPINKTGREKLIKSLLREEMEVLAKTDTVLPGTPNSAAMTAPGDETKPSSDTSMPTPPVEPLPLVTKVKERLMFTDAELTYMQKISELFGNTPRTINRYVNIYRLVKAHGNLKVAESYSEDEFKPIMFILAVIVGHSAFAEEFIANLSAAPNTQSVAQFLKTQKPDESLRKLIETLASEVESIPMEDFKRNLELISRFSFRTLLK